MKIFKYIMAINVVIVLLFVVFLFGVKLYQVKIGETKIVNTNEDKQGEIVEMDLENINIDEKYDIQISTVIRNANSVEDCKALTDLNLFKICTQAIEKKLLYSEDGISVCQEISDESEKRICKLEIDYMNVLKEKEVLECVGLDSIEEENQCKQVYYSPRDFLSEFNR